MAFPWFILPELFQMGGTLLAGRQQMTRDEKARQLMQVSSLSDIAMLQSQTDKHLTNIQEGGAAFKHEQKAMIGASGVKLTSGSPLAMLQKTDTDIQRDVTNLMDIYVGNVKKHLLESELLPQQSLESIKRGGTWLEPGSKWKESRTVGTEVYDFIKDLKKRGYLK